ncbi:MAG: hypothetical protein ACTHJK_00870 [Sphingomicrobium sp.]
MKREQADRKSPRLIDLGAASVETKALTYGADDSKVGLWPMSGLRLD